LVAVELVKLAINGEGLEHYRNTFVNLGVAMMQVAEPAPCEQMELPGGGSFTLWDQWHVQGSATMTLAQFIAVCAEKFSVAVDAVTVGSRCIYMAVMPTHKARLTQPMADLLAKCMVPGQNHVQVCLSVPGLIMGVRCGMRFLWLLYVCASCPPQVG
jgi:hypothetical protein